MNQRFFIFLTKLTTAVALCLYFSVATAQDSIFLDKVQFGGGLGVGFGSGYADINVSPGAVYWFTPYIAAGPSLQGSYTYQRDWYKNAMYGGSVMVLGNPIPEIQVSAEVQQLHVSQRFYLNDNGVYPPGITAANNNRTFWNTGLFLGLGYSSDGVTIGLRYNVLYHKNDYIYGDALMPFVRVYF